MFLSLSSKQCCGWSANRARTCKQVPAIPVVAACDAVLQQRLRNGGSSVVRPGLPCADRQFGQHGVAVDCKQRLRVAGAADIHAFSDGPWGEWRLTDLVIATFVQCFVVFQPELRRRRLQPDGPSDCAFALDAGRVGRHPDRGLDVDGKLAWLRWPHQPRLRCDVRRRQCSAVRVERLDSHFGLCLILAYASAACAARQLIVVPI